MTSCSNSESVVILSISWGMDSGAGSEWVCEWDLVKVRAFAADARLACRLRGPGSSVGAGSSTAINVRVRRVVMSV